MMGKASYWWPLVLVLVASLAAGVEVREVRLVGLFKNTAVLQIKGAQRTLKVGKTSPEGVKLISTERNAVVVDINGEAHRLGLARAVSRYAKEEQQSHIVAINRRGQYFTAGSINGRPVQFLVDTGATAVAMNTEQARHLGIDFSRGEPTQVGTAGGIVKAYSLTLDSVKVGGIEVRNVDAAILEGVYPAVALLGMTYLRHVKISEADGVLTLTRKY